MVDIVNTNKNTSSTKLPDPNQPKPLESLLDTSKLPTQGDKETFPQTSPSRRFFDRIPGKKMIFILAIFLLLMFVSSAVLSFLKQGNINIQNKGEIVWWGLQEEDSVVAPLITEFQAANPEVRITYVRQSEKDYADRLYNSLKKGTGPDIFEIHTSWIPDYRGLLYPIPGSVMSEEDYKSIFLPAIYNSLKTNDGIVGIPLYYDALTLYINVDIFNNARKEPPKTWNDILFLSDPDKGGLTLRSGKETVQSAIALGNTTNVDYWQDVLALVMYQNKINPAIPDVKLTNDAISYLRDFERSGVWNNRLPSSTITFSRGSLAMYFGTVSRAPEILRLNPNLRFKTIPLPQLPNNAPTDPQYSYTNYYFQAVSNSSTNKQVAWQFLKFMSDRSSIEKLNQGRKSLRAIDFPPPRKDMISAFEKDAVIGSVLLYSDVARSWYLADKAHDSDGGINTNVSKLYKDAFDKGAINPAFASSLKDLLITFEVSPR